MESWVGIIIFLVIILIFIGIFVYLWSTGASTTTWLLVGGLLFLIIIIGLMVWAFYPSTPTPPPVMHTTIMQTQPEPVPAEPQYVYMKEERPPPVIINLNAQPSNQYYEMEEMQEASVPVVNSSRMTRSTPTRYAPVAAPQTRQVPQSPSPVQGQRIVNRNNVPIAESARLVRGGATTFDADPEVRRVVTPGQQQYTRVYDRNLGAYKTGVLKSEGQVYEYVSDPLERQVRVSYG